jgi:hypothetical protein
MAKGGLEVGVIFLLFGLHFVIAFSAVGLLESMLARPFQGRV